MSRSTFFLPPQGHFIRPQLGLASPARRMAWFGITLSLVSLLLFRLGAVSATAFFACLSLACGLLVAALLIGLAGLAKAWFQAARGGSNAFKAAVVATIGLAPFALAGLLAAENPPTNRAFTIGLAGSEPLTEGTSLTENTGLTVADLAVALPARRYNAAPVEVAEAVQTAALDAGFEVEEIVPAEPDGLEEASNPLGVLTDSGQIPLPTSRDTIETGESGPRFDLPARNSYIVRAQASDFLVGLPSDVTIRIAAEAEGTATVVDIRSVSRLTGVDFGQNRRFIEAFYQALDIVMSGKQAVAG